MPSPINRPHFACHPTDSPHKVGFWIGFQDCFVSVQFGQYHHCDNYVVWNSNVSEMDLDRPECSNAEIAVLAYKDGRFITEEIKEAIGGYERGEKDLFNSCPPETFVKIAQAACDWREHV